MMVDDTSKEATDMNLDQLYALCLLAACFVDILISFSPYILLDFANAINLGKYYILLLLLEDLSVILHFSLISV